MARAMTKTTLMVTMAIAMVVGMLLRMVMKTMAVIFRSVRYHLQTDANMLFIEKGVGIFL